MASWFSEKRKLRKRSCNSLFHRLPQVWGRLGFWPLPWLPNVGCQRSSTDFVKRNWFCSPCHEFSIRIHSMSLLVKMFSLSLKAVAYVLGWWKGRYNSPCGIGGLRGPRWDIAIIRHIVISRGRPMAGRQVHALEEEGSIPSPASMNTKNLIRNCACVRLSVTTEKRST